MTDKEIEEEVEGMALDRLRLVDNARDIASLVMTHYASLPTDFAREIMPLLQDSVINITMIGDVLHEYWVIPIDGDIEA